MKKMTKSKLGFIFGIVFNVFGLLGLLKCEDKDDKVDFILGWVKGFVILVAVVGVVGFVYTCWTNAWQLS